MHPSNLPRSPLGHVSGAAAMWGHGEATQPPPEIAPVLAWAQTAHPDPKPAAGCLALVRAAPVPESPRAPQAPAAVPGRGAHGCPHARWVLSSSPPLCWGSPTAVVSSAAARQGKASWVPPSRPGCRPLPPYHAGNGAPGCQLLVQLPPQEPLPMEAGGEVAPGVMGTSVTPTRHRPARGEDRTPLDAAPRK